MSNLDRLASHLENEHDLILVESELQAIEDILEGRMKMNNNKFALKVVTILSDAGIDINYELISQRDKLEAENKVLRDTLKWIAKKTPIIITLDDVDVPCVHERIAKGGLLKAKAIRKGKAEVENEQT